MRKRTFAQMKESANSDTPENDQPPAIKRVLHRNAFTDYESFVAHYYSLYG